MKIMGMIVARHSFRLLIVGFSVKIFRIEWSGLLLIYDSSILCTAAHKIGHIMIPWWSVQSVTCDSSHLITKSRELISDRFLTVPIIAVSMRALAGWLLVLIIIPKGFSAVWDIKSGTIVAWSVFVLGGRENFRQGWKVCLGWKVCSWTLGLGVGVEGLV